MGQLNETGQSTNGCKPKTQLSTEDTTFDCISRQAALAMIEEYFNGLPIVVHYDMLAMIHRLPSAQPEQPKAIGWICPACGRGLSPYTSVCPCKNGKGWEITC